MTIGTRVMYDSIDPAAIPLAAQMVAGYVDGIYGPNHARFHAPGWDAAGWARFPNAAKVRIAVSALTPDGHVLDVETGDATPAQSVDWALMRAHAGVQPVIYCNASTWPAVRAAFRARHVLEPLYWIADWVGSPTLLPGTLATQYANPQRSGGHFDLSFVAGPWPNVDPPALAGDAPGAVTPSPPPPPPASTPPPPAQPAPAAPIPPAAGQPPDDSPPPSHSGGSTPVASNPPTPPPSPEPGYTTTEFWLSIVTSAITLVGTTLVDFGVVPNLTAAQRADITGLAVLGVTVIAAGYAIARSIRKNGLGL